MKMDKDSIRYEGFRVSVDLKDGKLVTSLYSTDEDSVTLLGDYKWIMDFTLPTPEDVIEFITPYIRYLRSLGVELPDDQD